MGGRREQSEAAKARKKFTYETGSYLYNPGTEGYAWGEPEEQDVATPASSLSDLSREGSVFSAGSAASPLDQSHTTQSEQVDQEEDDEDIVREYRRASTPNDPLDAVPLGHLSEAPVGFYQAYEYHVPSVATNGAPIFSIPAVDHTTWDATSPSPAMKDPRSLPDEEIYSPFAYYAPAVMASLSEGAHRVPTPPASTYDPRSSLDAALLPYHDMIRSNSYDSHFVPDPAYQAVVNHYTYRVPDHVPLPVVVPMVPIASTSTYVAPRTTNTSMQYYPYQTVTPVKRRNTGMPAWGSNTPGETY